MRLKELPDWSKMPESQSVEGVLKGARSSQLGHFAVLDVESDGVLYLVLLMVSPDASGKIISLFKAHIGRPMREIGDLEVDV